VGFAQNVFANTTFVCVVPTKQPAAQPGMLHFSALVVAVHSKLLVPLLLDFGPSSCHRVMSVL
jgi:hypothetical protein